MAALLAVAPVLLTKALGLRPLIDGGSLGGVLLCLSWPAYLLIGSQRMYSSGALTVIDCAKLAIWPWLVKPGSKNAARNEA